ncbi:hypothetical protein [Xanthomonas campestris]|uniref:hypothetical protein n=1 Tax=Xanthomonas campestris TaxID=339 RepID=UPI001864A40D|nr:hypothetical protein [Xanthomonas campestris]
MASSLATISRNLGQNRNAPVYNRGIGLLLTTVIITMPTVAAALWQGSMGSFMAFSAFDRPTASSAAQAGRQGVGIFRSKLQTIPLFQKPHVSFQVVKAIQEHYRLRHHKKEADPEVSPIAPADLLDTYLLCASISYGFHYLR